MKYLATLFLALILLFGLSCDNITEPAEILSTTEKYTKILSRDGFWVWDSTYAEEYIHFEDSLYVGYIKIWRLYYLPNGIYYYMVTYKSIDGEILREFNGLSYQYQYQWRIIEENKKWSIKYILPYGNTTIIPIMSLNNEKLIFEHRTYNYISNE